MYLCKRVYSRLYGRFKQFCITPIPRVQSGKTLDKLRPISLTKLFGRIFEKFLSDWTLGEYGNILDSFTTHYLVDLVDEVGSVELINQASKLLCAL